MLWILSFHIIFMVAWFAGLFYLPRLFVYHAAVTDEISNARFKIMERRLYRGIMTPAAILTVIFGIWLLSLNWQYYLQAGWMHVKLTLVLILIGYHFYCGHLVKRFKRDNNPHSATFYRFFNEIPTLLLISIIILVEVKPF
ncbi:MAG: protoporphyrinogen oxidase HemJ [Pseudomonadota bacterium]